MFSNSTKYIYTLLFLFGASQAIAAPVNDNPCQAISLTPVLTCTYATYTNVAATATLGVPSPACAGTDYTTDVWFSVVVPANGQITIDMQTGGMTDSGLAIYTGTCGSLALVSCDDDSSPNGAMSYIAQTGLVPGSTVYLRVWGYSAATGTFGICVTTPPPAPSNDNPCAAIPLTINSACNYISTTNIAATASGIASPTCGVGTMNDIWYSAVVPANGILVFDSSPGTLTNTAVAFYTGTCGALVYSACNDNGSHTGASMSYLYKTGLTPGSTVYIRVWGQSAATGTFGFCVSTPPVATSLTPANDACSGATPICDFNGYQGNTSSTYTTAGPAPTASNTGINGFCGVIDNNSWLKFTAAATTASFNVFVTGCTSQSGGAASGGIQMAMYSTTCGAATTFTRVSNCINDANFAGNPNGFVITANSLTIGNQYVMMIDGYSGDVCNYTIGANGGVDVISIASSVPSKVVCLGGNTTLTVDAVGTGPFTYTWAANATLSATNTAAPVATPTTTTTYTVTVTGGNCGAQQTSSVTITVANPTLTMTTATATCDGSNGTATVAPSAISGVSYTYLWSAASQTTATATNLTAGTYTVTVTNAAGCTATGFFVTTPNALPAAPTIDVSVPLCIDKTTELTAIGGFASYLWSDGTSGQATTISAGGVYSVTITNAIGCKNNSSVTITVENPTLVNIAGGTYYCEGGSINLQTNTAFSAYKWSTAADTRGINVTTQGNYSVTATAANGCTGTTTIFINEQPLPDANAGSDQTIYFGQTAQLTATGGTAYLWQTANSLSNLNTNNPIANPFGTTTYTVLVTDGFGCSKNDDIKVIVFDYPDCLKTNEGVSPNGDGKNDTWQVPCLQYFPNTMQILNRWGQTIYTATNYNNDFDGISEGKEQPDGTYYYIIQFSVNGITKTLKGTLTIIR